MNFSESRAGRWARFALPAILAITGGMMTAQATNSSAAPAQRATAPTVEEARQFTDNAEKQLLDLWIKDGRADWVQETYITDDTQEIAAEADEAVASATAELAAQA